LVCPELPCRSAAGRASRRTTARACCASVRYRRSRSALTVWGLAGVAGIERGRDCAHPGALRVGAGGNGSETDL